jgi:hypothetical protein
VSRREEAIVDRFSSHEDVEWAKGPFDDGAEARIFNYALDQCPSEDTIGPFAVKSWRAGWADALWECTKCDLGKEYAAVFAILKRLDDSGLLGGKNAKN